jgi:hypothetical protein
LPLGVGWHAFDGRSFFSATGEEIAAAVESMAPRVCW